MYMARKKSRRQPREQGFSATGSSMGGWSNQTWLKRKNLDGKCSLRENLSGQETRKQNQRGIHFFNYDFLMPNEIK